MDHDRDGARPAKRRRVLPLMLVNAALLGVLAFVEFGPVATAQPARWARRSTGGDQGAPFGGPASPRASAVPIHSWTPPRTSPQPSASALRAPSSPGQPVSTARPTRPKVPDESERGEASAGSMARL